MREIVKEQIRFVCKSCDISYTKDFIDFVYNKHLPYFSGELLKELKKDFENSDK